MPLRDVFENIVRNEYVRERIKEVLSGSPNNNFAPRDPAKYNAYGAFVDYQMGQYAAHHPTLTPVQALRLEGFQGGVPWVGDLENAPVLFLSSNPAFTVNQCTPRYHAYEDSWTINTYDNGNMHMKPMKMHDLWNFYAYPLSDARYPLDSLMVINHPDGNPLLTVRVLDDKDNAGQRIRPAGVIPKPGGVNFWNDLVKKILVEFSFTLLNRQIVADANGIIAANDLAALTERAVFTEIVPFQSMNQQVVNAALGFCWEDFSQKILSHSAAKLWIIVGNHARLTLSGAINANAFIPVQVPINANNPLDTGGIYQLNFNGRQRTLWVIPHPAAHGGAFNAFLGNVTPQTWGLLRKSIQTRKTV